jgi:hypothetical protein
MLYSFEFNINYWCFRLEAPRVPVLRRLVSVRMQKRYISYTWTRKEDGKIVKVLDFSLFLFQENKKSSLEKKSSLIGWGNVGMIAL